MSADSWVHAADTNVTFDYADEKVHGYLSAWISCCGGEARCEGCTV
jgi:hypothetical protein